MCEEPLHEAPIAISIVHNTIMEELVLMIGTMENLLDMIMRNMLKVKFKALEYDRKLYPNYIFDWLDGIEDYYGFNHMPNQEYVHSGSSLAKQ